MEENITFFAGAGFSRAVSENIKSAQYKYDGSDERLNMPLATDIFLRSKTYLSCSRFYKVLGDYLENTYNNRFPPISYEEVYHKLLQNNKDELAELLEKMVFQLLGADYPPIRHEDECTEVINIISACLKKFAVTNIITTNPDLLIDVAIFGATEFDERLIKLAGGSFGKLEAKQKNNNHPAVLRCNQSGYGYLESIKSYIKIHGSVNYVQKKCGKVIVMRDYTWHRGMSINIYLERTGGGRFCVIPPSTPKRYNEKPWNILQASAVKVLEKTDALICYGFGFSESDTELIKIFDKVRKEARITIYDIKANDASFRERAQKYFDSHELDFVGPSCPAGFNPAL